MSVLPCVLLAAAGNVGMITAANFTITVGQHVYQPGMQLYWRYTGYTSGGKAAGSISPNPPILNGYTITGISNEIGSQTWNCGAVRMSGDVPSFWKAITVAGVRYPISSFTRAYSSSSLVTSWTLNGNAKFPTALDTVGNVVPVSFEL